jgi:ABC-type multidrug transport system fused ATPase/permease subunit
MPRILKESFIATLSRPNLFLTKRGQAKILDFGLVKLAPEPQRLGEAEAALPTVGTTEEFLTSPGTALGTVAYMSPEQARGEELDTRTDLFSFGVVMYEMGTARPAFFGGTSAVIFDAILHRQPASPVRLNPELPAEFERIINKLMEKDRDLRYQSAAELRSDLKRLQRDTDSGRSPASRTSAATLASSRSSSLKDEAPAAVRFSLKSYLVAGSVLVLLAVGLLAYYLRIPASMQRATEMSFGAASISVIVLGIGLILGYGGYEVTRSTLTVGGLVAFYGYVFRLFAPVSIAIDLQSRLQRVGASIRRILEITNGDPQIAQRESQTPLRCDIKPELEFRSVWFCYNEDRSVLRDMSFRIEAGETVAVVGLNGSGKSTIGLLATRLYEPNAGSILVGGQDIRQVGRRSLRATLTLVPQDPVLFDETIRENLLYGNPRATGKDLETVAALTQLDRVLQTLPRGLNEPLGPLGGRLSGGEKKRLALARTLLQQPRILIVDEITSALDGPAAAGLLEGLELFRQARTLVVISHRPATILWADRILVVDEGAIVDSGKHDALILGCEAYRRIWQSQDRMPSLSSQRVVCRDGKTAGTEIPAS